MSHNNVWYDWPLILAYHSISEYRKDALAVRAVDFEAQMAWLSHCGYRAVTLSEFAKQDFKRGERIVLITFDDGYADNYTVALPILKRYGFLATIFLVTDYVNSQHIFEWDTGKITPICNEVHYRILTWDQVHEMANYGIEFGSHTCTHPELTTLAPERCWEEIVRSQADLRARLGRDVVSFCYPRGDLAPNVIDMVEKAGYDCAVVTPKRPGISLTRYTLRRIGIYHHNVPWLFRLKTSSFIQRFYERVRWPSLKI